MPIYTRFGDGGSTALFSGKVVSKDDPRIEACGSIDELNTLIGVVIAFSEGGKILDYLENVQEDLFAISTSIAAKGHSPKSISPARISELEKEIDILWEELPPLTNFIVPGGSKTASLLHLARTVCRRTERRVVALSSKEPKEHVDPITLTYLNRLGDLLFAMARSVNYRKKHPEHIWKGRKPCKALCRG